MTCLAVGGRSVGSLMAHGTSTHWHDPPKTEHIEPFGESVPQSKKKAHGDCDPRSEPAASPKIRDPRRLAGELLGAVWDIWHLYARNTVDGQNPFRTT